MMKKKQTKPVSPEELKKLGKGVPDKYKRVKC